MANNGTFVHCNIEPKDVLNSSGIEPHLGPKHEGDKDQESHFSHSDEDYEIAPWDRLDQEEADLEKKLP